MINKYNNSSLARQGYYTSYKDFDSKSKPKRLETSRAGILSLLIGIIIILVPVTYYLSLKSQVTSNKIVISELNHKLDKLKIENDANEIEMKSKLDLNNIYDTAIKKLGMKKLTIDQIKYFKSNTGDYFKQRAMLTK